MTAIAELFEREDALGLGALVRAGEVTPRDLVEEAIERIERVNPKLNAVILTTYDLARAMAGGQRSQGPFAGVPFLLKELATLWQGIPTTNACPYFKDVVAPVDMEIVRRIKAAGFILVGKTNAPEMGWALTTEPAMYGKTHNPWRPDVTPGGSSGGSAAAVAAGIVPLAEASDGAGSIRVPASHCGLVGLKPSRGRTTLAPVYADYWFGAAHFLCVSRTVRDTAAYLDAVAGTPPGDPYNTPPPARPWLDAIADRPRGLRIGLTTTPPDGSPVHPEAVAAVEGAGRLLEQLGHRVERHDLAIDAAAAWTCYTRMTATQTAAGFAAAEPLVGRPVTRDDVCPTVWAIIERGRSVSGVQATADYEQLRLWSRAIATELDPFDVYLTPTVTHPPRPFGYWDMNEPDLDRYNAKWTDGVFMFLFNLSGQPAVSIPLHMTADGLPMGVQLVGRPCDEATILRLAAQLEEAAPWRDRRPPVHA